MSAFLDESIHQQRIIKVELTMHPSAPISPPYHFALPMNSGPIYVVVSSRGSMKKEDKLLEERLTDLFRTHSTKCIAYVLTHQFSSPGKHSPE